MKIEVLNENQIRCTLTKEDLADRQIKLSELAYGSDKAKALFCEMIQTAATDYGFSTEESPLMVEAIPFSAECIILIITKVSDPEELDTRFSRFTPFETEDDIDDAMSDIDHIPHSVSAEEVLNSVKKFYEQFRAPKNIKEDESIRLFQSQGSMAITSFPNLDALTKFAHDIQGRYHGNNRLYRTQDGSEYTLVMYRTPHSEEEFNRICFLLPEYGTPKPCIEGSDAHIAEHYTCIIKDDALQVLSQL